MILKLSRCCKAQILIVYRNQIEENPVRDYLIAEERCSKCLKSPCKVNNHCECCAVECCMCGTDKLTLLTTLSRNHKKII